MATTHSNAVVSDESVRTVHRDGREYLQFPIVALREMVYEYPENRTREYLPAEHIRETAELWNGVPITYIHPQNRTNSAASPSAYTGAVIGEFHDPEFTTDSKIRGNALLDVEKAESVGGLAAMVVEKLRHGETLSVSASYVTFDDYPERGTFNGDAYNLVQGTPLPDHIAVFPSDKFLARCTPEDGCAAPKANAVGMTEHDCGCGCGGQCERESTTENANEIESERAATATTTTTMNSRVFESQAEKNRAKQLLVENGFPGVDDLRDAMVMNAAKTYGFKRESEVDEYPAGTREDHARRKQNAQSSSASSVRANANSGTSGEGEQSQIDPDSSAHSIPGVNAVGSRSSYENRASSASARARREKSRKRTTIYEDTHDGDILSRPVPGEDEPRWTRTESDL